MTISELKIKHDELKKLNSKSKEKVFGSTSHKFEFNKKLSLKSVEAFEKKHKIVLPTDYKNFLTQIGNGGSGPYYGLNRLSDWGAELENKTNDFLSCDFPHTELWNLSNSFDDIEDDYYKTDAYIWWETEYYSDKQITGSMHICHYGCGVLYILIVSGKEAGNIWIDDRANYEGIYPVISKNTGKKMDFLEWYGEWLDENIELINSKNKGVINTPSSFLSKFLRRCMQRLYQ